jgi:hypothetical protein
LQPVHQESHYPGPFHFPNMGPNVEATMLWRLCVSDFPWAGAQTSSLGELAFLCMGPAKNVTMCNWQFTVCLIWSCCLFSLWSSYLKNSGIALGSQTSSFGTHPVLLHLFLFSVWVQQRMLQCSLAIHGLSHLIMLCLFQSSCLGKLSTGPQIGTSQNIQLRWDPSLQISSN